MQSVPRSGRSRLDAVTHFKQAFPFLTDYRNNATQRTIGGGYSTIAAYDQLATPTRVKHPATSESWAIMVSARLL